MIPEIKKILYATDLSKNSAYALQYAMNSSSKHNAEIIILHVLEELSRTTQSILSYHLGPDVLLEKSKEKIAHVKDGIDMRIKRFYDKVRADVPDFPEVKVSVVISEGFPADQILRKVDQLDCDAIIMGTHGKGFLGETFLGSVAKGVLRRTRKPVFIIPLPKGESDLTFHEI